MRTRIVIVAALSAALLALPTLAAAAAAESITIDVRPAVTPWAGPVEFEGVVSSGRAQEEVVVEERSCGSDTFRPIFTTETLAGGRWDLEWNALEHSGYRARWRGAVSHVVTVQKRPGVTLRNPGRGRYVVTVFALRSFEGRTARLERFIRPSRRWSTVRRFRLTESNASRTTVVTEATVGARVARNTLLRVVTPPTNCYLAGFSNMLQSR